MFLSVQKQQVSNTDTKHIANQNNRSLAQNHIIQRKPICPCGGGCPGCMQAKLKVSQLGDTYEQEADRIAEQVINMSGPISPNTTGNQVSRKCDMCEEEEEMKIHRKAGNDLQVPEEVAQQIDGTREAGQPLDDSTQNFMESRFGFDFSKVRIHTDERAAKSAQSVNALAYTVGSDIVFGKGQYQPNTLNGGRLLAHELIHVVQQETLPTMQNFQSSDQKNLTVEAVNDEFGLIENHTAETITPNQIILPVHHNRLQLQRKPVPMQTQTTVTSTFSVNQTAYLRMLSKAIDQMGGRIVLNNTMAGQVIPILRTMLAQASWVDSSGMQSGGGTSHYTIQDTSPLTLNLRLLLDDHPGKNDTPPGESKNGDFQPNSTNGILTIFIRNQKTVDDLSETLYHESLHMMAWLINRSGPRHIRSTGRLSTEFSLDKSHYKTQIKTIRDHLEQLRQRANTHRPTSQQISVSKIEIMAGWLFEEVQVRAETEVFRLAMDVQHVHDTHGPSIILGTPNTMLNRDEFLLPYVFLHSKVFSLTDQTNLTTNQDREMLRVLGEILQNLFQIQVSRRFSLSPYTISIPHEQFRYEWPPLTPPPFRPLPTP